MKRKHLINFPINIGSYDSFSNFIIDLGNQKKSSTVCIANVHMFIEAYKDSEFLKMINNADLVTPDGKPLCWALQILYNIKQPRVAGMDLLPDLLKQMELKGMPVFFYGGSEKLLESTQLYLNTNYPALKTVGFISPPYHSLNKFEENIIIEKINALSPSIVFVILGCPKQEKWMAAMKGKINSLMVGIGGALPVMIGEQKRAPKWMQNKGLEWFFRFLQEPTRLYKRYANSNWLYIWVIFKEILKIKILKPFSPKK